MHRHIRKDIQMIVVLPSPLLFFSFGNDASFFYKRVEIWSVWSFKSNEFLVFYSSDYLASSSSKLRSLASSTYKKHSMSQKTAWKEFCQRIRINHTFNIFALASFLIKSVSSFFFNPFIAFFLRCSFITALRNVLFLAFSRFLFFFVRCVFARQLHNLLLGWCRSLTRLRGLCFVLEILVLPWQNFAVFLIPSLFANFFLFSLLFFNFISHCLQEPRATHANVAKKFSIFATQRWRQKSKSYKNLEINDKASTKGINWIFLLETRKLC